MLPRKHRLTSDKDITRVLRQGRAVFTNLLAVKVVANKLEVVRTTVVVSTKVDKRATKRNLIKRRVRSVLSLLIPKINTPVDIVVTAKNEAVDRDQAVLGSALEYCLQKLRLL